MFGVGFFMPRAAKKAAAVGFGVMCGFGVDTALTLAEFAVLFEDAGIAVGMSVAAEVLPSVASTGTGPGVLELDVVDLAGV